jgi:hypothetical protein
MDATFFLDNLGLVILALALLGGLLLFLLVRAALRRSRETGSRQSRRQQEPRFGDERYHDYRDEDRDYRGYEDERAGYRENYYNNDERDWHDDQPARRGVGSAPRQRHAARRAFPWKSIWFVIGIGAGAGGMALWNDPSSIQALMTPAATPSQPAPVATPVAAPVAKSDDRLIITPAPAPTPVVNQTADASPASSAATELSIAVTKFVANLNQNLPMAVQPGVTITAVTSDETVVLIQFNIADAIAKEDVDRLQIEVKQRFRESVCATPAFPDNIHGLSNQGASFVINYTDLLEATIFSFSAGPNFCSSPAE